LGRNYTYGPGSSQGSLKNVMVVQWGAAAPVEDFINFLVSASVMPNPLEQGGDIPKISERRWDAERV
jgi:hypothetical protein